MQKPPQPSPTSGAGGITLQTKLKVYRATVLPTLLYARETWTMYQRHAKKINHFHTTCLTELFHIKWQYRILDIEVLTRAGLPSINTILMQSQPRWAGLVARMPVLYHDAVLAKMGRSCSSHARSTAAQKTVLYVYGDLQQG